MQLSRFAKRLGSEPGINRLMADLGEAMSGLTDSLMLGGGNPGDVPQVREAFREEIKKIVADNQSLDQLLGNYDPPKGRPKFISALKSYLNSRFNWNLTEDNICVTNGSQTASYYLFNMFSEDKRDIVLPLCPEYLGYADQGVNFRSVKPVVEKLGPHQFKYKVNFSELNPTSENCGALALSRPTNPTGNVVTETEIENLRAIAKKIDVPLMVDNAYGAPFPNMIFSEIKPVWDKQIVLMLSLSKLGLPSCRTGIVIANEEIIRTITSINAVCSLSNNTLGQELVTPLLISGKLEELCTKYLKPFYKAKADFARNLFIEKADGKFPFYLHETEGAMFLWIWFEDMKINCEELYKRLAAEGVIVVPGHYFFYGTEDWPHKHQCIRVNFSGDKSTVEKGLAKIAQVVEAAG